MNKIIIDGKESHLYFNLKELIEYKDLLFFLVLRDVKVIYKQTILGFGWAIVRPVVTMIIFTLVFGKLVGIENTIKLNVPYPIFIFIALVPWTYFSSALSSSSNSLVGSANLLSKVYFPRIIIPATPIFAKLVDFFIAMIVLLFLFYYYDMTPHLNRLIYLPLIILMMILTSFGAGLWLSAMTLQYRDVQFIVPLIIQLLLFCSPIIWPITIIPPQYKLIYGLFPMAGVIEGFREAIIGIDEMPWDLIKMGYLSSTLLFVSGFFYFKRKEKYFADVL